MDILISLPTPVSQEAEQTAEELGITLEELLKTALSVYLASFRGKALTEMLNSVYEEESSEIDPVLTKMQLASLEPEEW